MATEVSLQLLKDQEVHSRGCRAPSTQPDVEKAMGLSRSFSGLRDSLLPMGQMHWTSEGRRRPQGPSSSIFPCLLDALCPACLLTRWYWSESNPEPCPSPFAPVFKPRFIPSLSSLAYLHFSANKTSLTGSLTLLYSGLWQASNKTNEKKNHNSLRSNMEYEEDGLTVFL